MNDSIDLKRVRHLLLLSEELHFSRAAERAHLSQTAFSRSIQSLEADLGVRLFDRDTRSVMLTSAGQQLIARARELMGCASKLVAEANDIAGAEGGELSFGVSLMAANVTIPNVLTTLKQRAPKLVVNVEVNYWIHLLRRLELEHIEFVVTALKVDRDTDPRFAVRHLPPQPASIFCRRDHPLALQDTPITHEQILAYPWNAVSTDDTHARALFGLPPGTPLPWRLICNELSWLRHSTLTSDALLLTWQSWVENDVQTGVMIDLVPAIRPAIPAHLRYIQQTIVCHAGRTLSPIAKKAIDLIIQESERQQLSSRD
ncbi:LysR family transcriptional regulator [Pseudomonas sp. GCM10022186]|uniref:LysR family transcriptional regulator n=1 Tax=Pseudomonas sp. GCM10022186 TaxID=3252650 RepID=UPI003610119B